ncbi:MAG: conjugal transfer protein TraG N-terminal domain-containing protein [Candidatus Paracaedimonas acanthamoebae]|jgi:conjugal transfer mating pair stabilization protein TraG|uniref:Conjugal transfer protein TraG N-terminal domain-containing protein n=1 Tax=Candidatus Paracaedimonas acanthamoebae TaxID=244581 RepID=A0A8J7Q0W6_9PROT|nr:conjugal transfer protein TraG N-terminal domain-containing protein [Candidatus Paracaedimonas acanthamoebae]
METTIYTLGGGEIFSLIFNGIASLISGAEGHKGILFNPFVRIGAMTGLLVAIVQTLWRDQMEIIRSFFIPFIVMLFVVLTPTTKVHIIDNLVGRKEYVVANVPFGLGFVAGLFSQIGQEITEKIEQVFSLPDDLKYHKTGAVFASNLLKNAKIFHIVDENVAENMRGFVTQCVVYDALLGRKYTFQDLKNSEDIWGLVTKEPSPVRAFLWQEVGKKSEIVTCKVGAEKLDKLFEIETYKTAAFFGKKLFRTGDNAPINFKAEIYKYLPISFSYLINSAKNAQEIIKQQIMIHSVLDGIENKSVALGNAPNVALRKAYLQQRNTNTSLGELAADTLPVMKILLEAIIYVAFLVVFPLVLMPWGWKVFKAWLELVVWIQCWAPLYAVLNMIMTVYGRSQSLSLSALPEGHGVTIANSVGLIDFHADLSAMAGWAAISIPFLAGALVKGGVSAFNTLATHLGGVSQSVASRAGDELTSGNYSLGNVSLGTVQANNTNMNQHMLSGSWHSGAFTQNDGRIQEITTADGAQIMDEKISSLASNMNISESMQSMFQRQAARSETAAHNSIVAASQQEAKAYRDMIDLARHQATNKNLATGYSNTMQGSLGKSLSHIHDKTQSFVNQTGLSYDKASQFLAEAAAGISGSVGFKKANINASIGVRGDVSSKTGKSALYLKAENFVHQNNLREDFNTVRQAARDLRGSISDDVGQRYAENISSSLDRAEQYRVEASASLTRSKSFTESASTASQHGWAITDAVNQEYMEWLPQQSYMGTPGPMGTHQAKHIALNDSLMNRAYQRKFLEERQAALDNYFDHIAINSVEDVTKAYQQYSASTPKPDHLGNHYSEIHSGIKDSGFKDYKQKENEIEKEITHLGSVVSTLADKQQIIQQGEDNILSFGNDLSRKIYKEQGQQIKSLEEVRKSVNGDSLNEKS